MSLTAVFSLGLITIIISLSRFAWGNLDLDVAPGGTQAPVYWRPSTVTSYLIHQDVWYTAELCVALTVASLPSLKALVRDQSSGRPHSELKAETARSASLVRPYDISMDIDMQIRKSYYREV
jgi:hypothetical protein